MEFTPLVMPQFQPLLAEAGQMSYQNMVAVLNDDNSWWLGYIQDMNGELAFIHFDSKKVTNRWVHMGRVWALPFYADTRPFLHARKMQVVYAALRDEDDGPFRFRQVTMFNEVQGCETCRLYYIKTVTIDTSDQQNSARCELVQHCQITPHLPPAGSPLLLHSISGLRCTKYMVPFPAAPTIFRDASDKFRIIKHFRHAFEGNRSSVHKWDCCRFHLRAERDGCMFIFMGPAVDAEMAQNMVKTLTQVLETHLASREQWPAIIRQSPCITEPCRHEKDGEPVSSCTVARLGQLPPSLLSEIFPYLDLHSQMRAKRVCTLWQLLLNSPRLTKHISISFETCAKIQSDNNNCFRLAALLSRTLSSTTESLTVLGALRPQNRLVLNNVLEAIKITLPLIVYTDHIITYPGPIPNLTQTELWHPAGGITRFYGCQCKLFLLHNLQMDHLFAWPMYAVFKFKPMYNNAGSGHPLPAHEQAFMADLTKPPHEQPIDQVRITIPRLMLRGGGDLDHRLLMAGHFMFALNDNFPPSTEDMLARVTAVYARWVRTLIYPDDWEAVRNYLIMFSPFEPDGRPQRWAKVDLRLVDVRTLSRMAIYGIDAVFRV
ncbi:uncharacterized protein LOC129587928 isoform X2 [Paramacrobiotus metropolitanus]|uniref:uncharacterized protein LOC129587928 isoform X2 n=1 Tax=Paramacrobiotus metropolitanus TaxID=2943436 RepID=UPI0024458410|nr:uncharacterized protein LOC129587928 isoform X2 [Paramacrobiotus metropolitanus]